MASNTNITGGRVSYASREKQMAAFDRLPQSVRAALADAAFDYAPYPIWHRLKRGICSAGVIITLIAVWDAQQIAKGQKRNCGS